ncbi:hypothetical protein EGM51_07775 [Verrucomicrobia bacterium S94]|nr:hypothetical protein EGM51_07775 [Verrucomicrobia bacterium S94]
MRSLTTIAFWTLFAGQCIFSFTMFEQWNSNVLIPFMIFIAAATLLFGKNQALLFYLLIFLILIGIYETHADSVVYYEDKASGTGIALLIIFSVSYLKEKVDGIRELNRELDSLVRKRDRELTRLTDELLENAENRRRILGQELHDGIGQQLTGIKLLCSSLELQLKQESTTPAGLAHQLSEKASNAHDDIRMIARTLFPVRIAHVGLYAAIDEMIACYSELHRKYMRVIECSDMRRMTEPLALQLYRMCQECCTFLLEHSNANSIIITLRTENGCYVVEIEHDGQVNIKDETRSIYNLIRYRADRIKGSLRTTVNDISKRSVIYFKVLEPLNQTH